MSLRWALLILLECSQRPFHDVGWGPDHAGRHARILSQIESGDPDAADRLLPLVYDELRKHARKRMSRESADHTLQATALVHEAYLRLVGEGQTWKSRGISLGPPLKRCDDSSSKVPPEERPQNEGAIVGVTRRI